MGYSRGSVLVQIPMKNCRTKGSDSALQSPSLAKLISVKFLGVRVHQGGELTSLPGHICVCGGKVGGVGYSRGSDPNEKLSYQRKR